MAIFKKWWFYPAAAVYLLFGLWFGSLNYQVHESPDKYPYVVRHTFFPWSTALKEGWACGAFSRGPVPLKSGCIIGGLKEKAFPPTFLNMYKLTWGQKTVGKYKFTAYVGATVVTWPIKVVVNIASLLILYVVAGGILISTFVTVIIMLIFGFLFGLIATLLALLL